MADDLVLTEDDVLLQDDDRMTVTSDFARQMQDEWERNLRIRQRALATDIMGEASDEE